MAGAAMPSVMESSELFFEPGTRVLAIPSWRSPRLLLPANTLVERVSGSAFYPAFRKTGKLYRWVLRLRAAAAIGANRKAAECAPALAGFLQDALPGARVRAVQVGIPGRACKLTAQLVDGAGRVVGYLKCAELPQARERLRHELAILRLLPPGAGPVPLRFGPLGGRDALLITAIPGTTLKATTGPPPGLRRFCASLVRTATYSPAEHPGLRGHEGASGAPARLLEALEGRVWPVALQHGDLAPWNLIRDPPRGLAAIDWEYGVEAGFPGLDLAQYVLQVAVLVKRLAPADGRGLAVRELLRDARLGLSRPQAAALVALAARQAYDNAVAAGCDSGSRVQAWRRRVWEHAADA